MNLVLSKVTSGMRLTFAGISAFLFVGFFILWNTIFVQAARPDLMLNGEILDFKDASLYIDKQTGRTMVPAREIAERMGFEVIWDRTLQQVTFRNDRSDVVLTIGEQEALVGGELSKVDAPAIIKHQRTMVPLRFVSESLGADLRWDEERNLVLMTSSDKALRATWIWHGAMIESDPSSLLQFAEEQKLSAIYVRYDLNAADRDAYRTFIGKASKLGIRVEALAGASDWIYEENHDYVKRFIASVAEYNRSVNDDERFQGYHFDIEPYTLDIWKKKQTWVIERWMDTIRLIETEVRAVDENMTMAFDIPFWLNKYAVPGTDYSFSAWLLEKADIVVIMAYRDLASGSNGIITLAKPIILEATTLKKKVIVAVDTLPSKEGMHTTFHAKKPADIEMELQTVMEHLSPYPSYSGVAIHDYVSWRKLFHTNP